ncbi:uncharacterized protein LOC117779803 [Drosophila innubila]|uniref:uncharacterized protein LOC117779803 n=1 Tax=Drosophila innubila TaxID=198719 RepID=UPI00148D5ABD|nr:uncharacterized protein LOC117779803 [Drosophila innubila]
MPKRFNLKKRCKLSLTYLAEIKENCERQLLKCRPFLPNVPHIVGDEDELNEADDRTQVTNGSDNEGTSNSVTSYDLTDDEESSQEEEEEDWSNNISYIVRTPERVPYQEKETPTTKTVVEVDLTEDSQAGNDCSDLTEDIQAHDNIEDEEDIQSKSLLKEVVPNEPDSPVVFNKTDSPKASHESSSPVAVSVSPVVSNDPDSPMRPSDLVAPVVPNDPASPVADEPTHSSPTPPENDSDKDAKSDDKNLKEDEASTLNNAAFIGPMEESRRLSLRSAYRANPSKSEVLSSKTIRGRSRPPKSKSKSEIEKPATLSKTTEGRVAKRSRQDLKDNSSPVGSKSPEKLAKPVEVTEYFNRISAILVSHRVNSLPFLDMRQRIDLLVGEAIAKTKSN